MRALSSYIYLIFVTDLKFKKYYQYFKSEQNSNEACSHLNTY